MTSLGDVTRPAWVTARLGVFAPAGDTCARRIEGTASAREKRAAGALLPRAA